MAKFISITDGALNNARFDKGAFHKEIGDYVTAQLARDDYDAWPDILAALSDPRSADYGFEHVDLNDFTAKFFKYTNARDDRRSDAILDAMRRGDSRFVDAHAYKMQAFNDAENAMVKKIMALTGETPTHFVHVGCGGTLETMLNTRDRFIADGTPLAHFTGLDKRPEVLKKGQDIVKAAGLPDFAIEDADKFAPVSGESTIFCFAAYLFPNKTNVIQGYLDQLDAPAILVVRNMAGLFGKMSPRAQLGLAAQLIGTQVNKDFSVESEFYYFTPQ